MVTTFGVTTFGQARRAVRISSVAALCAAAQVAAVVLLAPSAQAQSASNCGDVQKILLERKAIAGRLTPAKGQKMDAGFACANFGKLVANGSTLIKWVDANKEWCQIPDSFATGIKEDNNRAVSIRAKACGVAAKQAQMEKQAKDGGVASGGLLGGPGLEGASRLPQGAL